MFPYDRFCKLKNWQPAFQNKCLLMSDVDVLDLIHVFPLRLYITTHFVFQKYAIIKHGDKNSF